MKRRHFLINSAALAGAAALPLLAFRDASAGEAPVFTLAQLDSPGGRFRAVRGCSRSECVEEHLRVHIDAFHAAEPAPVLRRLQVQALFDVKGAPQTPYIAWRHEAGSPERGSRAVSFVAGRECMRGLALDYLLEGKDATPLRAHVPLTHFAVPLLHPGEYVLAGPRADGRPADVDGYRHSGDPMRPLLTQAGQLRGFDYLALRIVALS